MLSYVVWEAGTGINRKKWTCIICEDRLWRDSTAAHRHEERQAHQQAVRYQQENPGYIPPNPLSPNPRISSRVSPRLQDLLVELSEAPFVEGTSQEFLDFDDIGQHYRDGSSEFRSNVTTNFSVNFDPSDATELQSSEEERGLARLAEELHAWLLEDTDSDDSEPELQEQDEVYLDNENEDILNFGTQRSRRQPQSNNPAWFPWSDKETCILDILRHLPRSLFSDAQMDIILWGISSFGVSNAPSTDAAKRVSEYLQTLCGVKTERQKGPLGHVYYINQLAGLIRQEMANPNIRPHIHHYPEDSGQYVEHAWQADAWKNLDPDLASPMVRLGGQDFYIHELAKLDDGTLIMPFRWFTRSQVAPGDVDQDFYGLAWGVETLPTPSGGTYVVHQYQTIQFPTSRLLSSFPYLVESYDMDGIPDPRNILGVRMTHNDIIHPWRLTSSENGFANRWRALAKGHEVMNFAMWLYCDDTSGNISKKWNKHNSFLFTAAGLPQKYGHQESNVHFLCTSNLAPPLEMLDGITTQLEQGQSEGIWAWDILRQAMVLVIPVVLAMLGDNPMQSEFACHVGLAGKFFCRCCFVKGRDAEDEAHGPAQDPVPDNISVQSETSDAGDRVGKKGSRRKETIQELVARAKRFVGISEPRHPEKTIETLRSILVTSQKYNGKTQSKKIVTQTGVKDTFLESFNQQISAFVAKLPANTSTAQKQTLVDSFVSENILTEPNVFSPVWRIKGLDPHRDTPVEILHVILLGYLKYFWRDAISRLSEPKKEILVNRLCSIDVSSMGLSKLAGETLVKYARSLTGRDFRAIAQVAPFVLYDLVPKECFDAWLSLSALVPLVWQPVIQNLDSYLVTLELAIDRFLDCTANWTPRWFNKPKFHIIKHLPMHIRCFGPAVLYATEGFESFNAIIRDHSVHSNHQAPSRDIGRGFAQCSRIRHLLHGGVFFNPHEALNSTHSGLPPLAPFPFSDDPTQWVSAGPLPLRLMRTGLGNLQSPVACAYGLEVAEKVSLSPGRCIYTKSAKMNQPLSEVLTLSKLPDAVSNSNSKLFNVYEQAVSASLEHYSVGEYVVVKVPDSESRPLSYIGQVHEILQTPADSRTAVLLQLWQVGPIDETYRLHRIQPQGNWALVEAENILCPINTQHRCKPNNCDLSDFRLVCEERETTRKRLPRTRHYNVEDRLLNTNQMRSSIYTQAFRSVLPPLDREKAIHDGAAREFLSQLGAAHRGTARNGESAQTRAHSPLITRDSSPQPSHSSAGHQQENALTQTPPHVPGNPILQRFLHDQLHTRGRRQPTCTTCGQPGHNSRTCRRQDASREVVDRPGTN
ncbi:hypothetical protein F5051DRAFT_440725 [Lentinula edodes]|nr:hypothetical protein F5051DRAFT_440725 [Lentinula edodes]